MQAIRAITETLQAIGARPETITRPDGETVVKVNAPTVDGKTCETCARRETCTKTTGVIFGFCNTDYIREDRKP